MHNNSIKSYFWGLKAIVFKEFIHVFNDKFTLWMALLVPAIQLIIYGYAIDMDVKNIRSAVLDFDKSNHSKLVTEKLHHSGYFKMKYFSNSESELIKDIVDGKAKVGFIIPKNFQADVLAKKPTSIQILIDGSESSIAQQASNTSALIIQNYSLDNLGTEFQRASRYVEAKPRVLFNPDLKSINFMIPGLLGVILQIITAFLTSLSIVNEREKGTLEQLMVTPVGQGGLLIGKLIPYIIIGILQFTLVVSVMLLLFKIKIAGSFLLLFTLSLVFLFTSLSFGLLISTFAENYSQATQMLQIIIIPSILLSGFIFPRENMPFIMNFIGYFIPLTYFLDILRGIIIRGADISGLWHNIIPLFLYGVTVLYFAINRFKKQIA